jgi:DNA-binding transcriptional regulator YdaS (Cro superfamily)
MDQLEQYLTSHDMSQRDFAKLVGVSEPLVCQWRSGQRKPNLDNAFAIERATKGAIKASSWMTPRNRKTA